MRTRASIYVYIVRQQTYQQNKTKNKLELAGKSCSTRIPQSMLWRKRVKEEGSGNDLHTILIFLLFKRCKNTKHICFAYKSYTYDHLLRKQTFIKKFPGKAIPSSCRPYENHISFMWSFNECRLLKKIHRLELS